MDPSLVRTDRNISKVYYNIPSGGQPQRTSQIAHLTGYLLLSVPDIGLTASVHASNLVTEV